jgi:translation initiation factor 3 subunit D
LKPRAQKGTHATGAKHLGWGQRGYHDHRQRPRETSVRIEASWSLREEIEFARLGKLAFDPEEPELVAAVGQVPLYNKAFDRLTTKTSKSFIIDESVSLPSHCSLADDLVIERLASEGVASVFASDLAAAVLMAALRTVAPWDLQVSWKAIAGLDRPVMLLDQRADAQLHLTPVAESMSAELLEDLTAVTAEVSKINTALPGLISTESEFIALDTKDKTAATANGAYKYFKWSLGDGKAIVIRSALNCGSRVAGREVVGLLRGLFDCNGLFDASSRSVNLLDWRSKLDYQRGAVLAGEIKNNNAIIARWVFQAELAQADVIKLAYVSRATPKDRIRHELLALQDLEPHELAVQMSLDSANGFGILKALVDLLCQREGTGVTILRDPIKVKNTVVKCM